MTGSTRLRRVGAWAALALALELGSRAFVWVAEERLDWAIPSRSEVLAQRADAIAEFLKERPTGLTQFDSELGWTTRPGLRTQLDLTNGAGLRSDHEYAYERRPAVLRVAAFGDSFIYASGVDTPHAWSSQIEREHGDMEVLNFGVPSYGLDQAFLRFEREASRFSPDVSLLGVTCHDLADNLNRICRDRAPADFAPKPRFKLLPDGSLLREPMPVVRPEDAQPWLSEPAGSFALGEDDHCYEPLLMRNPLSDRLASARLGAALASRVYRRYLDPRRPYVRAAGGPVCNVDSPAFLVMTRLLREFDAQARRLGSAPIVLVLPDEEGVRARARGVTATCDPILDFCREARVDCLDVTDAFTGDESEIAASFAAGHLSEAGNLALARWLAPLLEQHRR